MNMTIFIAIIMLMYSGLLLSINKDIKSPSAILFFIWGGLLFLSGVNGDITNYTLCIILFSCLSFSVGALLAKPYAPIFEHVFSYNINNTKALVLITNIISFVIFIYTLIVFLYYYKGGFTESYINLRTEINYGDKSGLIKIYGYIYYLLYPLVYVWSFLYFKNKYKKIEGGERARLPYNNRTFYFVFFTSLFYALLSTAKIKVLLLIIPIVFLRLFFSKISLKHLLITVSGIIFFFYLSMLFLNKIDDSSGAFEALKNGLMNYSLANIFALDSVLQGKAVVIDCNGDATCGLANFISYKEYKTNVFTIFYSLTKYSDFLYSLIFFFVIGFFHSSLYNVAKKNKKTISVVICSILYFPLLFQFFDQLYMLMFYIYAIVMLYVICFCSRLTLTLKGV
ncbi:O-antigen polymerase [Shigella flexneri]|uniref:O-antigen polymerase n=1 Tax=Shigella flexneri TaxID=623 RepID=UPI0035B57223